MAVYLNCNESDGKPAARVGDSVSCPKHGNVTIVSGAKATFLGGVMFARLGDKTSCGAVITQGSSSVFICDKNAAFVGCATDHGGHITSGSPNVFVGTHNGELLTVEFFDEQFKLVHADTNIPIANRQYRITSSDGQIWEGISNTEGLTERIHTNTSVELSIEFMDVTN